MSKWKFKNTEDEPKTLKLRPFLIRSLDRAEKNDSRLQLISKLEMSMTSNLSQNLCEHFFSLSKIDKALEEGYISSLFDDDYSKLGLQLLSPLPSDDAEKTKQFLKRIFNSPSLFTVWCLDFPKCDHEDIKAQLRAELDTLIQAIKLQDLAVLARKWRSQRRDSSVAENIRILCECSDRWPAKVSRKEPMISPG